MHAHSQDLGVHGRDRIGSGRVDQDTWCVGVGGEYRDDRGDVEGCAVFFEDGEVVGGRERRCGKREGEGLTGVGDEDEGEARGEGWGKELR